MNLVVNFDQNTSTLPSGFVSAVNYVVDLFDATFTANVTVTIDVGYGEVDGQRLPRGALGESQENGLTQVSYSAVRNALIAQGAPGAATLPTSPPPGAPSRLLMGTAEEKALGLIPDNAQIDGFVGFSAVPNTFSYAINTAPPAHEFYFVGVVEHEFTEVMGRGSELTFRHAYSVLDLYRFAAPGQHQFTTGAPAYFSIDNGATNLNNFNNFRTGDFGDLGDWAPSAGNDAFNDTSRPGVINAMTATDLTVMAALGWSQGTSGGIVNAPPADATWSANGQIELWQAQSNGALSATTVPNAQMGAEWTAFGLGDFNHDHSADVVWNSGGQVAIWELSGGSLSEAAIVNGQLGSEWQMAALGDFNGDGTTDILWHELSGDNTGDVSVWSMSGTSIGALGTAQTIIGPQWNPVATGDFYQSGTAAVMWQDNVGDVTTWEMSGSTVVAELPVGQMPSDWHVAGAGNFPGIGSGDPTGDVVWVDRSTNAVQIWQMSGGQIAQIVTPNGQLGSEWTLQGVGDFLGVGSSQLLWFDSAGHAQIWQLNGSQVSLTNLSAPNVVTSGASAFADFVGPGPVNSENGGDITTVGSGSSITNPVIDNATLALLGGATVNGSITFASGSSGTLYDADQAPLPDTVVGFSEGLDTLSYAGENLTTDNSIVASATVVNGNTVLSFPDTTSLVLVGVTHVDTGIFA